MKRMILMAVTLFLVGGLKAADAETKKLTTESFKRELYWVAVNRGYRKLEHEKTENEKEVAKIYDEAKKESVITQKRYETLFEKMDSLVPRDKKYWEK